MKELINRSDYVRTLLGVIPTPDHVDNLVLEPDVSQTVPVPSGAVHVLMTGEMNYFVKYGPGPAQIPAESVTDGTGLELNPQGRRLEGVTHITVAAREPGIVQMAFWG